MNLSNKKNYLHLFFISILSIHYLLPLIFTGQVIVNIHDNLDVGVVVDHIISEIYKGNLESINYFLSGEIKWYYLEKLFYPINVLHYFFNDEFFYFTNTILEKLLAYFSFYLLAKSQNISKFNSALGGILYASIMIIHIPFGFGLPVLPYILYLLLNKKSLNKKHYFILIFIGLNSSIAKDVLAFIFLIPLSLLLNKKNFFLKIHLQIFATIFISLIVSNLHLIAGLFSGIETHREVITSQGYSILSFGDFFKSFFSDVDFTHYTYIFKIPLTILFSFLIIISLFSKQKIIKLIFYFIIFILVLKLILHSNLIDFFLVSIFNILREGFNFERLERILPIAYVLLFVFYISVIKNKNFKKFLYIFSIFSVISLQLMTPLPEIGQYFLKENMKSNKFNEAKKNILEKKYIQAFTIIFDSKSYSNNTTKPNYSTNKTFDNYYKFDDYAYIRNIVKNSRIMSVGLDPMIAVMNNIRVIDGYHTVYPLSYKIKFRKIIEKELENNITLKNYYDNWGNRVYAFYNNKNNLMLDFQQAKKLGADYVISKFPIINDELKIICFECNNSSEIFLYKIL